MEKKQNAIIFCGKKEVPEFMKQAVSWLENEFNLYYRKMPQRPFRELNYAWQNIIGPIDYVFVILDLNPEDREIIQEIKQKTDSELNLFLEDKNSELPGSFEFVLALGAQELETLENSVETNSEIKDEDYDDLSFVDGFNPCVIAFSDEEIEKELATLLELWGINDYIGKNEEIFGDQGEFLKHIKLEAQQKKYVQAQVASYNEKD